MDQDINVCHIDQKYGHFLYAFSVYFFFVGVVISIIGLIVDWNDASDTKRYIRTSFSETCVFVTCKAAKGGLQ